MQISDELMVIAWDMARSSSPLQRQMHADYLKAGIEAALSLPVQPVAWRDIDTPQGQERDAFKAGWWTNADYNQPASYLEQCEEVDWREYQKTGLDYYVSALIQAARNNADDEASSYAHLDTRGLVGTGRWRDQKSAARYEHVVVSEESRKADLLPTPPRKRKANVVHAVPPDSDAGLRQRSPVGAEKDYVTGSPRKGKNR